MAGPDGSVDASAAPGYGQGHPVPGDGTGQWSFGTQETGNWDTTSWGTGGWEAAAAQPGDWATDGHGTAFGQDGQPGYDHGPGYDGRPGYEGAAYGGAAYGGFEHAAYDAPPAYDAHAAFSGYDLPQDDQGGYGFPGGHPAQDGYLPQGGYGDHEAFGGAETGYADGTAQFGFDPGYAVSGHHPEQEQEATAQWNFSVLAQDEHGADEHEQADAFGHEPPHEHGFDSAEPDFFVASASESESEEVRDGHLDAPAALGGGGGSHGRGRRRSPKPRRRALMTVAVPSVAVMGVAGGRGGGECDGRRRQGQGQHHCRGAGRLSREALERQQQAGHPAPGALRRRRRLRRPRQPHPGAHRPQGAPGSGEGAQGEGGGAQGGNAPQVRHSRQEPHAQRALRPGRRQLDVDPHRDRLPVSYGTPVMAATDGTVSTKHSVAYGNMAIVTAKDGTQTWYCHLSSNKLRSGSVKAGDVIAYSGNSGNSTGPHLHFEVRPGGGSAVDPIPWLQSKGLSIS
ncbi:M23 family metallopeptidase [Streptomyces sp. GKU 257-1]|nr:M23 family metallopeptidase [Streptomyces sp. GKU 257-1]